MIVDKRKLFFSVWFETVALLLAGGWSRLASTGSALANDHEVACIGFRTSHLHPVCTTFQGLPEQAHDELQGLDV